MSRDSQLQRRLDLRFEVWLDETVEHNVPSHVHGPASQAAYRDAIAHSSLAALARLRFAWDELKDALRQAVARGKR